MQPTGDEPLLAGRYRLMSLLGRGGMADVYDAFDQRLDRPVAIKILRQDMGGDRQREVRFSREARSAARLSHPGVVAVYDSGTDQGRAYLVMERLPGRTLSDRMRAGPIDPPWLAARAAEVLDALGAAHALGLVHRDIKPANILLTEDGKAKLADFGIAKPFGDEPGGDPAADLTDTGIVLGTVAYLSPEQIHGDAASPRSDLYAVGVVLYEALTGRKPYEGPNPVAQAHAAVSGGAPDVSSLRPELDPGLAAVVHRAMATNPDDRYASAADMRAALAATAVGEAALLGSEPPVVAPTTVLPRLPTGGASVDEPTHVSPLGAASGADGPPAAGGARSGGLAGDVPPTGGRRAIWGIVAAAIVLLAAIGVVTFIVYNHQQAGPNRPATTTTTAKPASTTTASAPSTTASVSTTAPAPSTTAAPTTSATTAPSTTASTTPTSTATTRPVTTTASSVTTATTVPPTTASTRR